MIHFEVRTEDFPREGLIFFDKQMEKVVGLFEIYVREEKKKTMSVR